MKFTKKEIRQSGLPTTVREAINYAQNLSRRHDKKWYPIEVSKNSESYHCGIQFGACSEDDLKEYIDGGAKLIDEHALNVKIIKSNPIMLTAVGNAGIDKTLEKEGYFATVCIPVSPDKNDVNMLDIHITKEQLIRIQQNINNLLES